MGILVGIDPGKNASGVAVFVGGDLTVAYHGNRRPEWLPLHGADTVILERMQSDARTRGKIQDVIDCQLGGAVVAGLFRPLEIRTPTPREWKGNVPKGIHHERIWAKLTTDEAGLLIAHLAEHTKKQGLDILDAVGLGLWGLGRLKR